MCGLQKRLHRVDLLFVISCMNNYLYAYLMHDKSSRGGKNDGIGRSFANLLAQLFLETSYFLSFVGSKWSMEFRRVLGYPKKF